MKSKRYFQGYRTGLWIYYHSNRIIKEVGNYHVDINDLQPATVMDLFEEVEKNAIPSDSIDEESLPGFNDEDWGSGEWVFISGNDEEKFRRDGKWLEYDESRVLISRLVVEKT